MAIWVRSADDGGGILWFRFGHLIDASKTLDESIVVTVHDTETTEWGHLLPVAQRCVEALLPHLPDPERDKLVVWWDELGVDLRVPQPWRELFPTVVEIIRREIGDPAATVELHSHSPFGTAGWLASLIRSLGQGR